EPQVVRETEADEGGGTEWLHDRGRRAWILRKKTPDRFVVAEDRGREDAGSRQRRVCREHGVGRVDATVPDRPVDERLDARHVVRGFYGTIRRMKKLMLLVLLTC